MRIYTLTAPVFAARCSLLVDDDNRCVVVDPGGGVTAQVADVVEAEGLTVVGVLVTHGHADHLWDSAAVANAASVAVTMHRRDVYRMGTLGSSLGEVGDQMAAQMRELGIDPMNFVRPPVNTFGAGEVERTPDEVLEFGGVRVSTRHAPGHTEGSTLYLIEVDGQEVVLTGDVLFAGGVGNTGFAGGDPAVMERTLREVVLALPPAAIILPGHGPASRMDVEIQTNPFLRHLAG